MAPVSILAIGSYKSAAARVQPLCRDVVVGAGQPARLSGQRRHGGRRRPRLLSTRIFCTWAGREPRSSRFCQRRRRCVRDPRRWERRREDGNSEAKWVFCSSMRRMTDWQVCFVTAQKQNTAVCLLYRACEKFWEDSGRELWWWNCRPVVRRRESSVCGHKSNFSRSQVRTNWFTLTWICIATICVACIYLGINAMYFII